MNAPKASRPACLFCSIVAGTVAAWTVAADDKVVAFLDHRPLFHGHVLVVPRLHYETLLDLPAESVPHLFGWVQRVARAVESALHADGTFIGINNRVSQSVPHLHVHVVPRRRKDGLKGFFWPRHKYESESQALAVMESLRGALGSPCSPSGHWLPDMTERSIDPGGTSDSADRKGADP